MLKLVALVALFACLCWFGTHVQLGSHTLFGHLYAIAGTKESQDLFDGTRTSAGPLVDDVRRRIAGVPAPSKTASSEADDSADSKTDPAKPDRAKSDIAKPDPAKPDTARDELAHAAQRRPDGGPPQETLTASERRHLRRLISSAEGASARR